MNPSAFGGANAKSHWFGARHTLVAFLVLLLFCSSLVGHSGTPAQPSPTPEGWLRETEQALAGIDSYTAVFHRTELVDGKLIPEEVTLFKFKRPFKVYMKWLSPSEGQESLYVDGANQNKIRAHGSGLKKLVTINLDPAGTLAMKNCRHPITEAGLHLLVGKVTSNLRKGLRAGELTWKDHGEQTVYGRKTRQLEGVLPKDSSKGYYCYRCILNLDLENKMPLRTQIFNWDNQLVECYGYEALKLNAGLSDKDFEPANPEYHF
jgi:outer membrane lipoprotein-sorting protein